MPIRYNIIKEEGLTLAELLIVAGVLTVLITSIVFIINPLQKIAQTNDAKRKSDLAQTARALELYYQDYSRYPSSTASYTITGSSWGGTWPQYMTKVPQDPTGGQTYVYYTPNSGQCANGQCYYLYASLQRGGNDPQSCFPGTNNACANATANGLQNMCGQICNYGVSSQNTSP